MATAQDLLDLLEPKLLGFQDALTPAGLTPATENLARKVLLLNEGMHAVWRVLVSLEKEFGVNWFVKSGTVTVTQATFDANLAADLHDVILIEATNASYNQIKFQPVGIHQQSFKDARSSDKLALAATDTYCDYDWTHGNPPVLRLSRLAPTGGLALNVIYRYTLADLVDETSNIDAVIAPYRGPITNRAAWMALGAVHEPELAGIWRSAWEDDVASMRAAAAAGREPADDVKAEDYRGT